MGWKARSQVLVLEQERAQLQPSGGEAQELSVLIAAAALGATDSATKPLGEACSVWPWAPK